jgi:hypothetical protein
VVYICLRRETPKRSIVSAGHDFAQTADSYEVGVNGKEAIVLAVVKGEDAKLNGADVLQSP